MEMVIKNFYMKNVEEAEITIDDNVYIIYHINGCLLADAPLVGIKLSEINTFWLGIIESKMISKILFDYLKGQKISSIIVGQMQYIKLDQTSNIIHEFDISDSDAIYEFCELIDKYEFILEGSKNP